MDLKTLRATFRDRAVDTAEPYLWSDAFLNRAANEAQIEACRRAKLLKDSTSSFCRVAISAGDEVIMLDRSIIDTLRVRLDGITLTPVSVAYLDEHERGWESRTGQPIHIVPDWQANTLRLFPIPDRNYTATITVSRLPAVMSSSSDEPEIREEHQYGLIEWMLYRAFSRPDADSMDKTKSAEALANFEREFGRKEGARNEQWQRERNEIGSEPIA